MFEHYREGGLGSVTDLKLIFGFPVAERFAYSKHLYYSIKKFCYDPLVLFASNKNIGHSYDRLTKIKSRRRYRIHQIHNFVFDAFEEIRNLDFDYFVKLDSDCLFTNFGFEGIFDQKFDFLDSVDQSNDRYEWYHTKEFLKSAESYRRLLSDLELSRRDPRISGCFCALQIYSKKAVCFIADRIKIIESNIGYIEMVQKDLCLSELLIPNLLKDAGFKFRIIRLPEKKAGSPWRGVRWRPHVGKEEIELLANRDLPVLYHPINRKFFDKTRMILLKKIGYKWL